MAEKMIRKILFVTCALSLMSWTFRVSAKPLDQIIASAKKEGTVFFSGKATFSAKSMKRLEREIKEKYGVNLRIRFTPTGSMPKAAAKAMMEFKAGTIPSLDLMTFGTYHIQRALKAGVFEKVNWSSIIPPEVSPEVIVKVAPFGQVGLSYYTSQQGLAYNPDKVPASEVPKHLSGLADPK